MVRPAGGNITQAGVDVTGTQGNRKSPPPPHLATWLLNRLTPSTRREVLLGDFEEGHWEVATFAGEAVARRWYWGQALRSLPAFLYQSSYWSLVMLKNYLKVTLRNLHRHKGYTFINLTGLAVGMACCLLIVLYVQDELSYDTHFSDADRLYRLTTEVRGSDVPAFLASSPAPALEPLLNDFPEIVQATRLFTTYGAELLVRRGDARFYEQQLLFVDSTFFEVFDFPQMRGHPKTALQAPYSVVITAPIAKKYFGDEDPLGKTLEISVWGLRNDYTVTAVVEQAPPNTHFTFDFLTPFSFIENLPPDALNGMVNYVVNWQNSIVFTYLKLQEGVSPDVLEAQFPRFIAKHQGPEAATNLTLHLQPVTAIHLHSALGNELATNSDLGYVYVFSAIGLLIVLIACINFMNLSTARSMQRAKEVGVRKVLGAHRAHLTRQFLGESIMLAFLALPLALVLMQVLLPVFNHLVGKALIPGFAERPTWFMGLLAITLVVGLIAGSYPAFYLSRFRPARVLKDTLVHQGGRAKILRKGLVVVQFTSSIVLLIGTGVIYNQLTYLQTKKLGFDKEHVVIVPLRDMDLMTDHEQVLQEFLRHPRVVTASASSFTPGEFTGGASRFVLEQATSADDYVAMETLEADYDFLKTLGISLVAGRYFSKDYPRDEAESFVINEAAARALGWESPLGMRLDRYMPAGERGFDVQKRGVVVGVVQDFHFKSLHHPIEPLVMTLSPELYSAISVKISPEGLPKTLAALEKRWAMLAGERPFEYRFLDEQFDALYRFEEQTGQIFGVFAILAALIACLGLFGLASFTAEQRTKEIGIRKVLGASVSSILILLSRDFLKLVVLAFVVAIPLAYFGMRQWLQNFAYRTDMGVGLFILVGGLAVLIALATVSYQSLKAALADPVDAIRYE